MTCRSSIQFEEVKRLGFLWFMVRIRIKVRVLGLGNTLTDRRPKSTVPVMSTLMVGSFYVPYLLRCNVNREGLDSG